MVFGLSGAIRIFLLLALLIGSLPSVLAQSVRGNDSPLSLSAADRQWLTEHPVVRLGIDPNYAPYSFVNAQGKPQGVVVDLLPLLENRLGIHFKIVSDLDWPGLMDALRHKRLDAVATVVDLPERHVFIDFSNVYLPTPQVITTRKDTPELKTIADLEKLRVALVQGYSSSKQVVEKFPKLNTVYVKTPLEGLRAVASGEADAYVGVLGVNSFLATRNGLGNLKVNAAFNMKTNGQRFGVRKDWPELATLLNKALAAIPKGESNQIFNKWLPVQAGEIRRIGQPTLLVRIAPWSLGLIAIILAAYLMQLLWNHQLKRELSRRKEELEKAQAIAHIADWSMDAASGLIECSKELFRIAGRPPGAIDWPTLRSWLHPEAYEQHDEYFDILRTLPSGQTMPPLISHLLRPDGSSRWLEITSAVEYGEGNHVRRLYGTALDITDRKRSEEQIEHLAYHDQLTGLSNRALFLDRLGQALEAAGRVKRYGAVMFVDLDQFKHINDVYGHSVGDRVLQHLAQRLRRCLRQGDTVARFGGDEFIILLAELSTDLERAASLALSVGEKIRADLQNPIRFDGHEHQTTVSIGVSLFPKQGESIDDLIREADIAMYRAKDAGRNAIVFFEQDMQAHIEERYGLELNLREAVRHQDAFELFLQSQTNSSGDVCGAEALVRWRHPSSGLVLPSVFIPLAEETGLIVPIGEWVLRQVCQLLAQLNAADSRLRMSVNVSPRQFHHADFVTRVKEILYETGADTRYLTIEITENLLVKRTTETISRMRELSELGIRFSIDDFGTGYSSLAYLKRMPLNELKIDKSFIQDIPYDPNDVALVETILSMARHLGFEVVAEGVETQEQLDFLTAQGCQYYQGYFFHRPQHAHEWLRQMENKESPPIR